MTSTLITKRLLFQSPVKDILMAVRTVRPLTDESATPLAKVKLSNKLRMTNLVIEEGLGLCRVYNLVKENKDTANSLYKCMKCTNLSRTSAVKFSVHVSCFDGEVEETRGEHHSLCFPVPVAQIKAQEVDREQRTKLRKGFKTPRQAYEEGQAKAEALGADVLHYYPSWQRVRSSYYALAKKRNMK
ncbi:hypothetical protein AAVH_12397 [Aphelenchoides avenae]|nr:hypothetical protein AAVH_12397 [Aphelenchus avenae]